MGPEIADILVGVMMAAFGIVGLILASGARDSEMYLFGFALAGFAAAFIFGQIKSYFDAKDLAAARTRDSRHV